LNSPVRRAVCLFGGRTRSALIPALIPALKEQTFD